VPPLSPPFPRLDFYFCFPYINKAAEERKQIRGMEMVRKAKCQFHAEWSWADAMVSSTFRLEEEKLNSAQSVFISLKSHF